MDLDEKLYNDYLNGDKSAFDKLYVKYRPKLLYFVYGFLKDTKRCEDIVQDTFMYVMKNKLKDDVTFKYYIYLVAKSKSLNYINTEKRRNEIFNNYSKNELLNNEEDILDSVIKKENKKELIEAIKLLDNKYKMAVYFSYIEDMSIKEIAGILDETISNTKNLIHRGKRKLKLILLKKGFDDMNKSLKLVILIAFICFTLSFVVYASTLIYKKYNTDGSITMNPSYETILSEDLVNNLWVSTFNIAFNQLKENLNVDKIEFDENVSMASDLNETKFDKSMINEKDYLVDVKKTDTGGYYIYAKLNKKLSFKEEFDNFEKYYTKKTFGYGDKYIKYFGINNATNSKVYDNVEILFYNNPENDFAVKLKTIESDEIILYRTDDNKSFDEYFNDILSKEKSYTGRKTFKSLDTLFVPCVKLDGRICYSKLYSKTIKGTNLYIKEACQDVSFLLNEKGVCLESEALLVAEVLGLGIDSINCDFNNTFVIFMKEKDAELPYFSLKVNNDEILEKIEKTGKTQIIDYSKLDKYKDIVEKGECKFFEDEEYEYFFDSKKIPYVYVYFEDGTNSDISYALEKGKIDITLLDKENIHYVKKKK